MELERAACAVIQQGPCIALPSPGVGSSAFFSQYFCTADTFCQARYGNSVCTFPGPEDTHRRWMPGPAPQDPYPCTLCPGSGPPCQLRPGHPWWPGQCHGSTRVQPYFCCSRLLTGFPGGTLDLHATCGVSSPIYAVVTLGSCLVLPCGTAPLLLPCDSHFHFLSSSPLLFLHIRIMVAPAWSWALIFALLLTMWSLQTTV